MLFFSAARSRGVFLFEVRFVGFNGLDRKKLFSGEEEEEEEDGGGGDDAVFPTFFFRALPFPLVVALVVALVAVATLMFFPSFTADLLLLLVLFFRLEGDACFGFS